MLYKSRLLTLENMTSSLCMMMSIVVWAQEAVFIHIYLLMLMLEQVCSWVELPVQNRLCPIFVREVGSPDLHECFRGLTIVNGPPGFGASQLGIRA